MWPKLQETADLVTYTEEILNENFFTFENFLISISMSSLHLSNNANSQQLKKATQSQRSFSYFLYLVLSNVYAW